MKVKEKLVQNARKVKGFSQEKIAHLLFISQSQYSKLENGETDFSIKQLGILCDILDLNPLEIIEFSTKEESLIGQNMSYKINNSSFLPPPTNINNIELIRQIIREELNKL